MQPATAPKVVAETSRPAWNTPWPTAEEEKLRLFNQAQATAKKTQALGTQSPSFHARSGSDGRSGSVSASKPVTQKSEGSSSVSPYAYASASKDAGGSSSSSNRNNNNNSPPAHQYPAKPAATVPHYPTAQEEKAALRRYQEAKSAVDRTQGLFPGSDGPSSSEPISYDALYPSASSSSRSGAASSNNDLPPPFEDAAALARKASTSAAGAYRKVSDGGASGSGSAANGRMPTSPPLRNGSFAAGSGRPPPPAPMAGGSRVLSAIEEKALLKAKYEAEERAGMVASPNGTTTSTTPPPPTMVSPSRRKSMVVVVPPTTPPPLAPRPPAEYIRETREEDARVSRYVQQGITPPLDPPDVNGAYKAFSPLGSPNPGPPPPL